MSEYLSCRLDCIRFFSPCCANYLLCPLIRFPVIDFLKKIRCQVLNTSPAGVNLVGAYAAHSGCRYHSPVSHLLLLRRLDGGLPYLDEF